LLDAGIHFGHHCSRWNPKMAPYIYGKRNSIHIIDIRETLRGLLRAQKFLSRLIAAGEDVLLVGTKRQAREIVRQQAERCAMHYVNERWLGGSLTNFRTIRSRLQRLEELEALVGSPEWDTGYSKKMKSTLTRELRKIRRNLEGIRRMTRLPGALVAIDVRKEGNAVREARSLKIPTICLIDTDGDPDYASIAIPGNDDAIRAIELVITKLCDAIEEGKRARPEPLEHREAPQPGPGGERGRRRARRPAGLPRSDAAVTQLSADSTPTAATADAPGVVAAPDQPSVSEPESVTTPASGGGEAPAADDESLPAQT
jgi:small subunit ribosomal protein S2